MARSSFGKLQRDRDKRAKAAAKRERRQNRGDDKLEGDDASEAEEQPAPVSAEDTEQLLARIAELHERFEDGQIPFQTFEEEKAELMARLPVD